ncbi:hypothetical protein AX15_006206 [Amanita polypyramis BW_CC]|nr:hypothetical protein AX15_006206 [Amanita polypyramis BW_CC]
MFTKVVSIALLTVFVQAVFASKCTRTYVVKENDICDSISKENNASTYQLAVVNHGVIDAACTKLVPGQQICLGRAGEDCTTTYVVNDGDTCDDIQAKSGVNATLLYSNNPQINEGCTNIYIGEVLCVAKTVVVPAVPSHGASSVVVPPATAIPANPGATAVHPSVHPSATPTPTHLNVNNNNDDDLPFCDEL